MMTLQGVAIPGFTARKTDFDGEIKKYQYEKASVSGERGDAHYIVVIRKPHIPINNSVTSKVVCLHVAL